MPQKWLDKYHIQYPSLIKSKKGAGYAYCCICMTDFTVTHSGVNDCTRHIKGKKHSELSATAATQPSMASFASAPSSLEVKTMNAECLLTSFIVEHNLPIAIADHFTKLTKQMFPDSKIASKFMCGRTKATSLIKFIAGETQNEVNITFCL